MHWDQTMEDFQPLERITLLDLDTSSGCGSRQGMGALRSLEALDVIVHVPT
jgi:hypothetical protein